LRRRRERAKCSATPRGAAAEHANCESTHPESTERHAQDLRVLRGVGVADDALCALALAIVAALIPGMLLHP